MTSRKTEPVTSPQPFFVLACFLLMLGLTACGRFLPNLPGLSMPTPTFTPTPMPTATPTPMSQNATAAGAQPTPQVTIPEGFTVVKDERLRYSFAVPSGWTELDLQSTQFRSVAGLVGMGEQIDQLNQFLASPTGQMIGLIYVTDLMSAMFGGFPTLLNVTVVDAPGYTAEGANALVQATVERTLGGAVTVDALESTTINNLPAVRGVATANLAAIGMNAVVFGKVVGLLANERVYVLTLVTQHDQRSDKEPLFDQIIGTFRPE